MTVEETESEKEAKEDLLREAALHSSDLARLRNSKGGLDIPMEDRNRIRHAA